MGPLLDAGARTARSSPLGHSLACGLLLPPPTYPLQFAKTGNPNGDGNSTDPVWAPYGSAAEDNVAIINITESGAVNITMASQVRRSFCSFWDFNSIPEWRVY